MSFWSELKRRNVFKVGAAYVIVVAWVILQVASIAFPALNLPGWVLTFVMVILIIGLPLALIFTWAFELTADGVKRTALKTSDKVVGADTAPTEAEHTPAALEVDDAKKDSKTIAVLPLADLSPGKDQEYFVDGIAEELLNSLARISELEVRGCTSSFYFKNRNEDLQTISNILNVDHILEGSVRKAGEQVRITVQLINTRKDAHIWSKTYERTMDDIFAIQEDIARSVADALQITLGVGELGHTPGMTTNIDAYDAYLAGRSLSMQGGRENYSRAIEHLEKAVTLDQDFAVCWNFLARCYNAAARAYLTEKAEEFLEKSGSAYSRVVELLPGSDMALEIAASRSGDRVEVARLYRKALARNPANDITNAAYGSFLNNVGRPTEAIVYFKRLVQLEPLKSEVHFILGNTYHLSGNSDGAAIAFKKARELANDPSAANIGLLVLALEENNRALIDEFVPLLRNAPFLDPIRPSNTRNIDQVMHALIDTPEKVAAELRLFLNDPAYNNYMNGLAIATFASYFGEHELALQIHRKWLGSGTGVIWIIWRPIHKGMRRLPGFKDLVREIGLVDYWRKSGKWGEFCRPVGDDDFECE